MRVTAAGAAASTALPTSPYAPPWDAPILLAANEAMAVAVLHPPTTRPRSPPLPAVAVATGGGSGGRLSGPPSRARSSASPGADGLVPDAHSGGGGGACSGDGDIDEEPSDVAIIPQLLDRLSGTKLDWDAAAAAVVEAGSGLPGGGGGGGG